MALNYLLDPCLQHQNRAGVNNVHGFFKVFLSGTDDTGDIAETYSNFSGALNPERIEIDNNGRCVIIADDSHPYRVEMYLPNGDLVYTQEPVWPIANGGGGASITDIESSDGSISVDKTTVGGKTTFDIGVNREDDPQFLDWIKCSGSSASSGNLVPNKADGTMSVGSLGVELSADMLYHVSGVVRGTMNGVGADYDAFVVHLYLNDGETSTEVQWFTFIADRSLGLAQDFNFDADIKVGSADAELVISITGSETGMSFSLPSLDIHRVYSGIPKIPGGIATQEWVDDHYQKKLTAGTGITIDPTTNVISADAAPQVQSDWNETDSSAPDYIKNKPDLSQYATDQELTAGLATKQDIIQDIAAIRAGAQQGATAVQPSDLSSALDPYATKQEVTQGLSTKQNTIEDLTQIRQGASLGATALQPGALDPYATKQEVTTGLAGKQDTISDLATIRSGAAAGATAVQPGDLAAVATSGSYNDLSDKPSIPAPVTVDQHYNASSTNAQSGTAVAEALDAYQALPASTAQDAGKVLKVDSNGDPEWAAGGGQQVQSDWAQTDSSAVDFIKNKPNLAAVATSGSYNDLSDKPSIPPAQVQSDWNQSDSQAVDFIKNKPDLSGFATKTEVTQGLAGKQDVISDLATIRSGAAEGATAVQPGDLAAVATSGSYNDLSDKPSIPAAQVNADWNASSGVAEILNKPQNLVQDANYVHTDNNFTTTEKDKLAGIQAGAEQNVQSDWNQSNSSADDYIKNKPTIPVIPQMKDLVAGSNVTITEDANAVTISASGSPQVQADWAQTDSTAVDYIKNKPTIPTVDQTYDATSANAQSGVAVAGALAGVNQVPASTASDEGKVLRVDASGNPEWATGGGQQVQSDWAQTDSGAVDYIKNKPDIRNVPDVTANDDGKVLQASYSGGTGSYSWQASPPEVFTAVYETTTYSEIEAAVTAGKLVNVIVVSGNITTQGILKALRYTGTNNARADFVSPALTLASGSISGAMISCRAPGIWSTTVYNQVQANWAQTTTWELDYIKNKPTIPTVDQTYDATSTNAQSGVAVASALSGKEDAFDAGSGLQFTTDGQGNRVLQADETVIWTVPSGSENANNYDITLSETIHNFEEIAVYCKCTRVPNSLQATMKNVYPVCDSGYTMFADGVSTNHWNITEGQNGHYTCGVDIRLSGATGYIGENYRWGVQNGTSTWEVQRVSNNSIYPHPYKIVGLKRIANN